MKLDQIAREAAREANEAARAMPLTGIDRLRRRRKTRLVAPVFAAGMAIWVAILLVGSPPGEVVPPAGETTPTTAAPTSTTVDATVTTAPAEVAAVDAVWVRGTHSQIIDDQDRVLYEYPFTVQYGRNTAWDGASGFVALTDAGLIWMRPGSTVTVDAPSGSIVDAWITDTGAHVVGIRAFEDQQVHWIDLESGTETAAPTEALTLDGITFTAGNREATIELPDWSGVERDEIGQPVPPFDLPTLIVSEDGEELVRIAVGSEQRPYVNIHDFDGRRLIIGAEPFEPAVPPVTAWIIDLECAGCTQRIETESLEYFDLIGALPSEGDLQIPDLP